jgi:hypothetical protein
MQICVTVVDSEKERIKFFVQWNRLTLFLRLTFIYFKTRNMDPDFVVFLSSRGVSEQEYMTASLADKNPLVEAFQSQKGKVNMYSYLSHLLIPSRLSILTSVFCREIGQGGGEVQGQGELLCHDVVRCCCF